LKNESNLMAATSPLSPKNELSIDRLVYYVNQ